MLDITTIGTATIDTFLELDDVFYYETEETHQQCYCLPVGGKVTVKNVQKHFGGNAVNTAIGFSYLKLKTGIITSLGDCAECKSVIHYLARKKINTAYIKCSKQCKSAHINTAFILDWHKHKQDRIILSYHQPKNFKKITVPNTKWVYLTSLGKDFSHVMHNLPTPLHIAWNPGTYELTQKMPAALAFMKKVHILILNKQEAARLLQLQHQTASIEFLLNSILKLGPRLVAITSGENGAYVKDGKTQEMYYQKALNFTVAEVTGAGDAFASGFVAAYIKNKTLLICLRWGVLNATSCITRIGAHNGLLTLARINKLYTHYFNEH